MRVRYSEDQLMAILRAEITMMQAEPEPPTVQQMGRHLAGGEVQLPCHPRERVSVRAGERDATCPDCGQSFPLEGLAAAAA